MRQRHFRIIIGSIALIVVCTTAVLLNRLYLRYGPTRLAHIEFVIESTKQRRVPSKYIQEGYRYENGRHQFVVREQNGILLVPEKFQSMHGFRTQDIRLTTGQSVKDRVDFKSVVFQDDAPPVWRLESIQQIDRPVNYSPKSAAKSLGIDEAAVTPRAVEERRVELAKILSIPDELLNYKLLSLTDIELAMRRRKDQPWSEAEQAAMLIYFGETVRRQENGRWYFEKGRYGPNLFILTNTGQKVDFMSDALDLLDEGQIPMWGSLVKELTHA